MSSRGPIVVLVLSLAAFVALAMGDIVTTSPTYDEPIHLASGYTQLTTGDARFALDHPPLLKKLAALPLVLSRIWPERSDAQGTRALAVLQRAWNELPNANVAYVVTKQLFFGVRDAKFATPATTPLAPSDFLNDGQSIFLRARTLMLFATGIPLALLIFCWSYELWGAWAAAFSAMLFCFDPNFIAHCGLVTTDAGAVTLIFATLYFFWRATRDRPLLNGAACAICFAAAILSKFSAVLLLPMLVLLAWRPRRWLIIAAAIVVTYAAIWAAYGFRYEASKAETPVGQQVAWWYGAAELLHRYPEGPPPGARIARDAPIGVTGRTILFAERLQLFPRQFLYGFAEMRAHSLARGAFLRGHYSITGFRSYFFWAFVYKTPLVTMLIIVAGIVAALRNRSVAYLLVPVIVYLAVSVPSSINIGHRHILPIYPFLYVCAGALAAKRKIAFAAAPLIVAGALVVFAPWQPVVNQHLAYFNELAGGPLHGYELLTDSNVDWGQDLPRLSQWMHSHGVPHINLVYFGTADPRAYGIAYVNLGYFLEPESRVIEPGYLAISATALCGAEEAEHFAWRDTLRGARLVDRVGYSIFVYRIEERRLAPPHS